MNEGSKVRIISTGIIGVIVDVRTKDDKKEYTIESEAEYLDGYKEKFPLFDCTENELEEL